MLAIIPPACFQKQVSLSEYEIVCREFFTSLYDIKDMFTDITIVVDEVRIPCHKIILSAESPFFKNMFMGRYLESDQKEVVLKQDNPNIIKTIIDAFYSREIKIKKRNVLQLLQAANYLQVNWIENECLACLNNNLNTENCIAAWILVKMLYDSKYENILSYIYRNMELISNTEDFLLLDENEIKILIKDLTMKFKRQSADNIFKAILLWTNYNRDSRIEYIGELLEILPKNNLSTSVILSNSSDEAIKSNTKSANWLINMLTENSCYDSDIHIFIASPNFCEFWTIDLLHNKILQKGQTPLDKFTNYTMASHRNKVYFISNATNTPDTQDYYKILYSYDIFEDKWEEHPVGYEISNSVAIIINDELYMIGGTDNSEICHRTVLLYSLQNHLSMYCKSIPDNYSFDRIHCCKYGDSIYLFGHPYNGKSSEGVILKYICNLDEWEYVSSFDFSIKLQSVASFENKIFCCFEFMEVRIYNPETKIWTAGPSKIIKGKIRLLSTFSKLFAIVPNSIYKLEGNKWNNVLSQFLDPNNVEILY